MKKITSLRLRNLLRNTGLVKLALVVLAGLMVNVGKAQTNFATAQVLTGGSGSVTNSNIGVQRDTHAPNIAGFAPNAPLWYQWKPSVDGEVELDTIGSMGTSGMLDTVLGVFTGTSLATLNQVAANDDLYPINSSIPNPNLQTPLSEGWSTTGSGDYAWVVGPGGGPWLDYVQPYYGPSHLRFNARAGTTYYFAVDTKRTASPGLISLQWAYQSSGVFRFATEDEDAWTGLPLYQAAETESDYRVHYVPVGNAVLFTYYNYNVPGVLVTVTRVAGSTGRATVNYQTVDGASLPFMPFPPISTPNATNTPYVGAVAGVDYIGVTNTLVFDDYEMSKNILIPIIDAGITGSGGDTNNTVFGVKLSSPALDEDSDVAPPRVDPAFSLALVKILNVNADPYGPDMIPNVTTNGVDTNGLPVLSTNFVVAAFPTNPIVNFQKCHFCVPEDVNDTNNPNGYTTPVTIYVERSLWATNQSSITLTYRVNNFINDDTGADDEWNNWFPLQPGSDYAVPTPPIYGTLQATNPDFNMVANGTITFPDSGVDKYFQPITFTVTNTTLTKFNRDFKVELYQEISHNNKTVPALAGMVAETTVTILFNDQHPPAGSVDELYNADFNGSLALTPSQVPQTLPKDDAAPGVSGVVNSLLVLTNNEALIAGDFLSYNGYKYPDTTPVNSIALIDATGALDPSFEPNDSGINGAINALALTPGNQFIIGGSFNTAFNGVSRSYIARLNANGSLDTSFNPTVNGTIWAAAVQSDGRVLIGGDFNNVNGQARNHLARLNTDGTLDTTFDPGNTLQDPQGSQGSVYAISLPPLFTLPFANSGSGETNQTINLGLATAGTLTVNYNMYLIQADDMKVYYGDTNVAGGTGVLIYDTGSVFGTGSFVLPFGPISGLATNIITIVMDQGTGQTGNQWTYNGTVAISSSFNGMAVGGNFAVSGHSYTNVARFTTNGSLAATFTNLTSGANNPVYALALQADNKLVVGGSFTVFSGSTMNHIARLNVDGSLDATNFFAGTGANDVVWSLNYQLDGTIYVGGQFSSFNGTHRLGFTRLNANGTVDTTFLDTAYNQFAGLKRIYSYDTPAVFASGVQSDGNVIIGGSFYQVGGGQANTNVCNSLDDDLGIDESFGDTNLWVEPKARDGVRGRFSVARLIGGATPGPGSIGLQSLSFSANKSSSVLSVGLVRTNGVLGPGAANFSVLQSGSALSGRDFSYNSAPPLFWIAWRYTTSTQTRLRGDGLFGINGFLQDVYAGLTLADALINNQSDVTVSIIKNSQTSGNLNAQFQLANPSGADTFYLGGENIPLGTALGPSLVPFTLIDDTQSAGTLGFISPVYTATNLGAVISLVRSNGTYGTVTMKASTTNGTALAGIDYIGITNLTVTFLPGVVTNSFTVTILNNGISSTNFVEKYLNLRLTSLSDPNGGNAAFGISNAVLRLINPNIQGYLTLSATNYTANESAGFISFVVNRVAGSFGAITVQYATTNGTALSGTDYTGATNTLQWNSGDSSPRTITIPLIKTYTVSSTNKSFNVLLSNPQLNGASTPGLFYVGTPPTNSITNAVLTIVNDNSYGQVQFSAPSYLVSENGGYATITVVRTGGTAGPFTVYFYTTNGTAFANTNYATTIGSFNFVTNQTAASFYVPITNDLVLDPANFYFSVILSNATPATATLGSPSNAVVNILDATTHSGQIPGSPDGAFTASMNGDVLALALQTNGQILAGGNFTSVNGTPDNGIARLNANGSLDFAGFLNNGLYSGANGSVQAVVCQTDGRVVIGGSFNTADGITRNNIARLMTDGSLDTSFNPGTGADGPVYALAETFVNGVRMLYVGGSFNNISGGASPNFARLTGQTVGGVNSGVLDPSFVPGSGPNAAVYALAVYPTNSPFAGKVLIGGAFTNVNSFTLNHIARLNGDGSVDTNFDLNLGANDTVRAIAIQIDGGILIGGDFTNVNNRAALNHIARLNSDGTLDTNFVANVGAGVNYTVQAIAVQADNRIVLGGQFTSDNGVTRNRITRLLPGGAVDAAINFGDGANGTIDALVIQPADQLLVIGGGFTQYADQPCAHIARIYGGGVTGSGALQFNASDYYIDENGGQALITVIRTGGTSGPNTNGTGNIVVYFSTTDGTAVAGTNYTGVTNYALSFPPGEVLQTVVVPVRDDGVVTNTLFANLALTNISWPATNGSRMNALLHIINDDAAVSFSNATYTVSKNVPTGFAPINVIRIGTTNGTCSVNFITTANGTAVPYVDFIPTNTTVTFNPGDSVQQVQVPIINNNEPGNQTVVFSLANAVNAAIFSPSNATLIIQSSVNVPGQLCFSNASYTGYTTSAGGSAIITVLRTNGNAAGVSVTCTTVAGTALPGVDYTPTTSILTFNQNQNVPNQPFVVPLVANSRAQGPVYLSVVLSNPGGGATLIAPTNATLGIVNNNIGFNFATNINYVSETNAYAAIFVQCLGSPTNTVSVNYSTANGTATNGVNYTAVSGTLTFAVGETLQSILVPLIDNTNMISDLTFTVSLFNPTNGTQLAAPSNTVVVVQAAQAGLSFANSAASVFKTNGTLVVAVVCSNPRVEPLSVFYSTTNGTAAAGLDYTATSGWLVFANRIVTNTFPVTILNNSLVTGNRTFSLSLSSPTPPGQLVYPSNQLVTIIDNNSGLSFSSPTYTVLKTGVAATITVLRTDNTNQTSSVNFATANGTAVAGSDYFATNGTLVFASGQTSRTFSVRVINNTVVQPDKTVLLQLSSPVYGVLMAPYAATLTIHDNSGSYVVTAGSTMIGESFLPTNGIIDPGETVTNLFAFRDAGGTNVGNLQATLLPINGITSPTSTNGTPTEVYGSLIVNGPSKSSEFSFTANGTNGQQIVATFRLQDGTNNIGTNGFTYTLGTWTTTFSNPAPIIINDDTIATPYPSIINVSNVGGVIIKATVTLTNLSHQSLHDVDVLLVSPAQQDTVLMSHVGTYGYFATHLTLTFDDATNYPALPSSGAVTNGTYNPTEYGAPIFP